MIFTKEDIVRHISELRNGNKINEKNLSKLFSALSSSDDALELVVGARETEYPPFTTAKTFFALGFLVAIRCVEETSKERVN